MAVNQSLDIYSTIDTANVQSGTSNIPLTHTPIAPRKAQSSKDLFRSFAKKEITLKYSDKSAGQPELVPIFEEIKNMLLPYEKGTLKIHGGTDGKVMLISHKPVEIAGRNREDSAHEKITLTEVRQEILNQFPLLNSDDIIPVPCNPDALAMGYILKLEGETIPLTRYINPADLLNNETRNTIVYEQDTGLQMQLLDIFSTGISVDKVKPKVNQLLCCLPEVSAPNLDYDNLFRIIIMNFMDAYDFDVRAVKKSCVHIANKDLKMIPFETMNLFYRDDKSKYLEELRNDDRVLF
jgi:uncharacterized radical SAM superfamily Fe-S cluster-containing enzyme